MNQSDKFKKLSIENGEYSLYPKIQGIKGLKILPNYKVL
jgi:hypothetical protein